MDTLSEMSSNSWDDPKHVIERADTALASGDRELAYQLFARASELDPQDARAWQGRAETASSADEALVSYGYAAALDPDNQPLGRTLDAALDHRLGGAGKGDTPILVAMGQELAEVGLTDRAQTLLDRALELDPSSTDALIWLAGISRDDQKQLNYLNRALATNPRDPRARAGVLSIQLPTATAPDATPPAEPLAPSAVPIAAPAPDLPPSAPPATSASPAATDTEAASMARLRQARANAPATATESPAPPVTVEQTSLLGDGAMRTILIVLLALVLILGVAGILLLVSK